jgi:DNA-binding FadR family transcriptional regulator
VGIADERQEPLAPRPAPRERGKLHMLVLAALEDDILSGRLKVGDRLPSEADIGRTHGVSTRSVREALQILETKGLIRRRHGERAMVARDDVGEFLDSLGRTVRQLFANNSDYLVQLMDVRRIIESEVVTRLAAGERPIADEVGAALTAMRRAADAGDTGAFTDADADFHLGLVKSLGNEILNVVYDNLFSIIVDVIRVSSRVPGKTLDDGYREHAEIHRLIVAGDAATALAALRTQIDNSSRYLRIALDRAALASRG